MIINYGAGGGLELDGTPDQVVGFDANGKPTPVSKEDLKGSAGKTAYQYAVDGGYQGTEEEFQELMGTGPWLPTSGGTVTGNVNVNNAGLYLRRTNGEINTLHLEHFSGANAVALKVSSANGVDSGTGVVLSGVRTPVHENDAANKEYVDSAASGVPTGVIVMWSGAANAIPSGWVLCNGQNGTPDLRDRFIVGAGSSYSVGNTGGSNTVALKKNEMPQHTHGIGISSFGVPSGGMAYVTLGIGPENTGYVGSTNPEGGSVAHENRPPYYALCFIMKQ